MVSAEVPVYPSVFEWAVSINFRFVFLAFWEFWVYVGRIFFSSASIPLLCGRVDIYFWIICGDVFVLPPWKMVHMRKVIPKSDMYKAGVCSPSWLVKSQVFVGNISISWWKPLIFGALSLTTSPHNRTSKVQQHPRDQQALRRLGLQFV